MRKLLCLVPLLILISCKVPNPESLPDPAVLAKQQAPFGVSFVDVKPRQTFYNGRLISEFVYEGDVYIGMKGYATFQTPALCAEGYFKRKGSFVESFETRLAWVSGESQTVSGDMRPRYTLQFKEPKTESLREVSEEWFASARTYSKKILFNSAGLIVEEDASDATENGYINTYTRNVANNISSAVRKNTGSSPGETRTAYEYDDHPNPFFKLGTDWHGEFSILALSPNNVTRETYQDEEGRTHDHLYTYEYLPNGYPARVTVERKVNGSGVPFIIDLKY